VNAHEEPGSINW
jgi:hypothetical protein